MSARRRTARAHGSYDEYCYGKEIWDSRYADELEIEALSREVTVGTLEDRLGDRLLDDGITQADDEDLGSPKLTSAASEHANRVWQVLRERSDTLGTKYPFTLTERTLRSRRGAEQAYHAFLAIAWAHAVALPRLKSHDPVEVEFEELVAQAVRALGLLTAVLRVGGSHRGNFRDRLMDVGRQLAMKVSPAAASHQTRAKDEGADVVARVDWRDSRPGQWWLLGQATCGRSDSWSAKMCEPKPEKWKAWLRETQRPQRFLALPHHVTRPALNSLLQEGEGFVLDRLRLVLAKPKISKSTRELTKEVLARAKRAS